MYYSLKADCPEENHDVSEEGNQKRKRDESGEQHQNPKKKCDESRKKREHDKNSESESDER